MQTFLELECRFFLFLFFVFNDLTRTHRHTFWKNSQSFQVTASPRQLSDPYFDHGRTFSLLPADGPSVSRFPMLLGLSAFCRVMTCRGGRGHGESGTAGGAQPGTLRGSPSTRGALGWASQKADLFPISQAFQYSRRHTAESPGGRPRSRNRRHSLLPSLQTLKTRVISFVETFAFWTRDGNWLQMAECS